MERYKGVVIGCGKIGALFEEESRRPKPASHAGALMRNKKTVLTGLVDTDEKQLARAAKLFPHASTYASAAACLETERPDIVIIATPANVRVPVIRMCLEYGVKMVVCEKPLAVSAAEAEEIRDLLDGTKMTFVLNYQRRLSPLFTHVRGMIAKGKIGRVQQVTCYYSNGLRNNGGHIVDALLYLLDDPIISVVGFENARNTTHLLGDMNVDGMLRTKKGAMVALQSFDQDRYAIYDIRILGEKAGITVTSFGQEVIWHPTGRSEFAGIKQLQTVRGKSKKERLSATQGALEHAIGSYERGSVPESGITTGIEIMKVLDALQESASSGAKEVHV